MSLSRLFTRPPVSSTGVRSNYGSNRLPDAEFFSNFNSGSKSATQNGIAVQRPWTSAAAGRKASHISLSFDGVTSEKFIIVWQMRVAFHVLRTRRSKGKDVPPPAREMTPPKKTDAVRWKDGESGERRESQVGESVFRWVTVKTLREYQNDVLTCQSYSTNINSQLSKFANTA